jgi:hypothetical protein
MHVCMHVPTTAQPHLKGVRVCTTCASVCAATTSLIRPLCLSVGLYMYVCVSWCFYIQSWGDIHVQQAFHVRSNSCHIPSYVHTLTHIQHWHSTTVLCKQSRETHTLTEVSHTQKRKQGQNKNIYTHIHAQVCMFVCMIVWGARANQPHTRHHGRSRVCEWSLHVCSNVSWQLSCMLIKVDKQKTDTVIHISEA